MSKFGDIGNKARRNIDPANLQKVVNGGQVAIKKIKCEPKKRPLQVMLTSDTKNSIKVLAATKGISMTELFEEMYQHYKDTHESMES